MSMTTVFQISSLTVLPLWLLMLLAPGWVWTRRLMASPLVILLPSLLYAALVFPVVLEVAPLLANPRLEAIQGLLASERGATIAWVHFLAFDLFTARWAYLESRARGLSPVLTSLTLALILMFGPLGWLCFMALRALTRPRTQSPLPIT